MKNTVTFLPVQNKGPSGKRIGYDFYSAGIAEIKSHYETYLNTLRMKTLKLNALTFSLALVIGAGCWSCTEPDKEVNLVKPGAATQSIVSSMRCLMDGKPWEVDNSGYQDVLQVHYSEDTKFLSIYGLVNFGTNSYRGLNIKLNDIDLLNMPLDQVKTINLNNPALDYVPVSLIIGDPPIYEYLSAPSKDLDNIIQLRVTASEKDYAMVSGTFRLNFPQPKTMQIHTLREGEFYVKIPLNNGGASYP